MIKVKTTAISPALRRSPFENSIYRLEPAAPFSKTKVRRRRAEYIKSPTREILSQRNKARELFEKIIGKK